MFLKYLVLFAILCSFSPIKVDVTAQSAILMNAETGAVLFEKNAHTPMYPASTTKVFTAVYALQKKGHSLDEMVTASHNAVACVHPHVRRSSHPPYRLEFGGTHMGIKAGEVLPFRTLIYGLMLNSGNDAANVIAEHVSGDVPTFLQELNQFIKEKGCSKTTLFTPHGLPHEDHKSTAYDLAILAKEALKIPFLREVMKTNECIRPETNKQPQSVLRQHNALVRPGKFYYPKAVGLKTGYTIGAGYTLVAAAEDHERKLIAVVLGCEKIENRYRDAIALFEAGFHEKKASRTLFSKGYDVFTKSVEGGKAPLQAYLSQDLVLEYFPSEEPVFKTAILWDLSPLPIAADQQVGEMQVLSSNGKVLKAAPLFASKTVESTWKHQAQLAWKKVNIALLMAIAGIIVLSFSFYFARHRKGK
jgi:serine-type D-Ala-D-Ala carboxypeptidase (penicillin-binding protein 5/6)